MGKFDHELWPPHVAEPMRTSDQLVRLGTQTVEMREYVPTPDNTLRERIRRPVPPDLERHCAVAGNQFCRGTEGRSIGRDLGLLTKLRRVRYTTLVRLLDYPASRRISLLEVG